jgi:1-acyl-sn-glycerol-3-phosphate acyltransferase
MPFLSRLSSWLLFVLGWKLEGEIPPENKLIMIVAPHTSNWDFPVAILFKWKLKISGNYLAKHSIFWGPMGWFMRATGGIPVVRHEHHNVVQQVAQMFAERQRLWLGMAPSGTRGKTAYWRSGFYHMALAAEVPLMLVRLDFSKKILMLGEPQTLTGSVGVDMERIRIFFDGAYGYRERLATPVRLSIEDEPEVR